jgi:tetratricopeptide (TPR) repeat protein
MGQSPQLVTPFQPGARVGHYEILEEAGRGGMGVVYRARDLTLGRMVALKCPSRSGGADKDQGRRFLHEARAASRLSHPNIVPVFEVFEDQGRPWLAMELVEGTSLRGLLGSGRPLPVREILRHGEALASALQAAHERNVIHRDVNPNNIMMTADGRAVLTDFGLARFTRSSEESSTQTRDSSEGDGAGTPCYMSPEQALGKPLDTRTDIFSLGTVLYEMCTGQHAFPGRGPEVMDALLHREPAPISRFTYEVPEELVRIIRKALCKRPDERYQTAGELLADLRALGRQLDHSAYVEERAVEPRPRPLRWLLAAAGAAALAALVYSRDPRVTPEQQHIRLAILPPENLAVSPATEGWPELIQALYVRELTGVEKLGVLDPLTLNTVLETSFGSRRPRRSEAVYRALAATRPSFIIDGSITSMREGYRIQSNLMNPERGEVEFSQDVLIHGEDVLDAAVATLSRQMLGYLQVNVLHASGDQELRPWLPHRPRNLEAVKAFLQGNEFSLRMEPGARKYMKRAIELDPTFVSPRLWLISGFVMERDFAAASEHYRYLQGVEATTSPFEQAMIGWAGAYISEDHAAQARHLEIALQYSPDNNLLLFMLGEARFRMDDFEGSLAALAPLAQRKWPYPNLYTLQAASLLALGRWEEAGRALRSALPNGHVDPDVYAMLAALALRQGDADEAERYRRLHIVRSKEVGASAAAVSESLAVHLLRVGLYERAAESLRTALAFGSRTTQYHDFLAEAFYRSEKAVETMRVYSAALDGRPGWSDAHLVLARIKEARGDNRDAVRHYEAFLAAEPTGSVADGIRQRFDALRASAGAETAARR